MSGRLEVVAPAGTPAALDAAIAAGADAVYVGLRDETNARNFPGLNFSHDEFRKAVTTARRHGTKIFLALNTYPSAGHVEPWQTASDMAAALGADAVIAADIGLADYIARTHPDLRLHLSVQASASSPDAVRFYVERFGVRRVVLPRVLTVPEIADLNRAVTCETEVFVFGGLCVMAEGRCSLSSHATGKSPNMNGVCSPPSHAAYVEEGNELVSRLGGFTVNRFAPGENSGYPTLCKGRFSTNGRTGYVFEEPASLNALMHLADLARAGVTALKIEGRQRGKSYISTVVSDIRQAVDTQAAGGEPDIGGLESYSEGQRQTDGVYSKTWR